MELKKESIQMLRIKNKAAAQATFDEDYNVPDVKPDIGRPVSYTHLTLPTTERV